LRRLGVSRAFRDGSIGRLLRIDGLLNIGGLLSVNLVSFSGLLRSCRLLRLRNNNRRGNY